MRTNTSLNVVVTALCPHFECCVDTDEYGTLVLQGDCSNGSVKLESLSTLEPNGDDDGSWIRVPLLLFTANGNDDDSRHVTRKLRKMSDIETTLQDVQREDQNDKNGEPLDRFRKTSQRIFEVLLNALDDSATTAAAPPKGWNPEKLMELHDQLEDLESKYKNAIVVELSIEQAASTLTLQTIDAANRRHVIELDLSRFPINVSAVKCDVPKISQDDNAPTRKKAKLESSIADLYLDFCDTVEHCQDVWRELEDLDENTWVLEPSTNRSSCQRSIYLSNGAKMVVSIVPAAAARLQRPTIVFLGSQSNKYRSQFDSHEWDTTRSIRENLENCFGKSLAKQDNEEQRADSTSSDCAICFDTLTKEPEQCENENCGRRYHSSCLDQWLSSLPTSRFTFDTVIGSCPYCKDPIAVQVQVK